MELIIVLKINKDLILYNSPMMKVYLIFLNNDVELVLNFMVEKRRI